MWKQTHKNTWRLVFCLLLKEALLLKQIAVHIHLKNHLLTPVLASFYVNLTQMNHC